MNKKWNIIYYEDENNESEVYEFIEKQKLKSQAKILSWISLLEEKGSTVPRPYADYLGDDIYELRIKVTGDQVRILYFFCYEDFIVLTNVFIKRSDKVPKNEIKKAILRKEKFLKKYTKSKLLEEYNENI